MYKYANTSLVFDLDKERFIIISLPLWRVDFQRENNEIYEYLVQIPKKKCRMSYHKSVAKKLQQQNTYILI